MARHIRVGDLRCPGVDLDVFRSVCQIPLFKDQWNLWKILYSSTEDKPDVNEVTKAVHEWFDSQVTIPGTEDYHNLEISLSPPEGSIARVKRFQDCLPFVSTLIGSNRVTAYVRFIYRGPKATYDWPLFNEGTFTSEDCPLGVTWIAEEIYSPPHDKEVPDKPGVIPNPFPTIDPTKSVTAALVWAGVGLGIAGMLWYGKR